MVLVFVDCPLACTHSRETVTQSAAVMRGLQHVLVFSRLAVNRLGNLSEASSLWSVVASLLTKHQAAQRLIDLTNSLGVGSSVESHVECAFDLNDCL
jgi:hypothetical protein